MFENWIKSVGAMNEVQSGMITGFTALPVASAANISINPTAATLTATQSQQFIATVTNPSNNQVDWSISPAVDTISSTGLYTAPVNIPAPPNVRVIATSRANPALSAWATVTLS